jgi:hypothetical protein
MSHQLNTQKKLTPFAQALIGVSKKAFIRHKGKGIVLPDIHPYGEDAHLGVGAANFRDPTKENNHAV